MEIGLNKLKDIGAQTIYETTHISKAHVQALIHESFESFSSVQFLGFISILEKEYHIDLSELKKKGLSEIEQNTPDTSSNTLFLEDTHKKSYKKIYITLILFLSIFTLYFYINGNKPAEKVLSNEPTMQEMLDKEIKQEVKVKKSVKPTVVEQNTTKEKIEDVKEEKQIQKVVVTKEQNLTKEIKNKKAIKHSLTITTKKKLWIGYIELPSYKKHQQTFKGSLDLDPSKEWLILTAHGYVDVNLDGKVQNFKTKHRLRFIYKNNKLTKLTFKEFKKLNRGKAW